MIPGVGSLQQKETLWYLFINLISLFDIRYFPGDYSLAVLARDPSGGSLQQKSNLTVSFLYPAFFRKQAFCERRVKKNPAAAGFDFCCGEGGIRTPGTVARTPV